MIDHLTTRTVTYSRHSTSGTNQYGDPQDTWTPDGSTSDVVLQQTAATEVTVDGNIQVSDWWLADPDPTAGLSGRDRVVADEGTFEIVGLPEVVHTPDGPHHVEARLVLVDP